MKNIRKIFVLVALLITFGVYDSIAQIYVTVRPARPTYTRVVAPSPRHVWVEEDWEPRGKDYVFVGGRWAEPPRDRAVWVPGHWRETRRGWDWIPGHWR